MASTGVEALESHARELFACRACATVSGTPVTGMVRETRLLLVGQAPGPREQDSGRPFAYTAGTRLFGWFSKLGVPEETFRAKVYIAAVIRCFPGRGNGGDRAPSPDEIARCASHLDREIAILRPRLVITVGGMAAKQFVGSSVLSEVVGRLHRSRRAGAEMDVVALPHPSGRSTWLNDEANARMLERSLGLIADHEEFRRTFR